MKLPDNLNRHNILDKFALCPPPKERGTYFFCVDPVGVGVSVTLSCLHDISLTGGWILTKFAWM